MATCVLVVDDDEHVLRALSRVLERAGLQVTGCTSARSAREALEANPDIAVALVDLQLGPDDGVELVDELASRYPRLRLVALSGNVEGVEVNAVKLTKPVPPSELLRVLAELAS